MADASEKSPILLVEDQPDDEVLTVLALRAAGVINPMCAVCDGYEAICYLSGDGRYSDRVIYPIPALILLDLKMPRVDGSGVLEWLQKRPEYDNIAVVVLTSSNLDRDIARANALGADDFILKPNDHADLVLLMRTLSEHWLNKEPKTPAGSWFPSRLAHEKATAIHDERKDEVNSRTTSGSL